MTPTPAEIVAMLKKRPRACEAIRASADEHCVWFGPLCMAANSMVGSFSHNDVHDLAIGRTVRIGYADGKEPFRNADDRWCAYDMETGQPVTDPFPSPLEAMLEYLEKREEPE